MGKVEEPGFFFLRAGLLEEFEGIVGEDIGDIKVILHCEFRFFGLGKSNVF